MIQHFLTIESGPISHYFRGVYLWCPKNQEHGRWFWTSRISACGFGNSSVWNWFGPHSRFFSRTTSWPSWALRRSAILFLYALYPDSTYALLSRTSITNMRHCYLVCRHLHRDYGHPNSSSVAKTSSYIPFIGQYFDQIMRSIDVQGQHSLDSTFYAVPWFSNKSSEKPGGSHQGHHLSRGQDRHTPVETHPAHSKPVILGKQCSPYARRSSSTWCCCCFSCWTLSYLL